MDELENKKVRIYSTPSYIRKAVKRYYEKIKNDPEYRKKAREYQQNRRLMIKMKLLPKDI